MYRNLVILRKVIPSILRKYFLKLLFFHCLQLEKILEFMHVDRELFRTLQSLNFINVTSKLNVSYSCICFIDKAKISSICWKPARYLAWLICRSEKIWVKPQRVFFKRGEQLMARRDYGGSEIVFMIWRNSRNHIREARNGFSSRREPILPNCLRYQIKIQIIYLEATFFTIKNILYAN